MTPAARVLLATRRLASPRGWRWVAGRLASVVTVTRSGVFDRQWYERQVRRRLPGRAVAVLHYVFAGRFAAVSPHPLFEAEWYLPDRWRTAFRDPLAHYLQDGQAAGQSPHPLFDPVVWAQQHPAARRHRDGALGHFLASATPETPMPVSPDQLSGGVAPPTWGAVRRAALALLDERGRQEALRLAPRTITHHDPAADAAVVRRWAGAPLPRPSDGPLVSVVMPVRDRESVVGAAVASVRAQTLTDWELVVVDDGSRDGTVPVLEAAAAEDPRIVVVSSTHRGVSAARNEALRRASGRYVAFLDSDNVWTPPFLRTVLAALAASGRPAGYAVAELHRDGARSYRALDAQAEHLAVRNHVDLNVLVAERALLEDVGGFDEDLRRTVDYDLVWRLARRTELLHVPVVGVVYDDDRGAADRLSLRELRSWKDEVRRKHLVDWDAVVRAPRAPGRTSALVVTQDDWRGTWRAARGVLAPGPAGAPPDREVVVVDSGARPSVGRLLGALALVEPRLRVVRAPDDVDTALGTDLALAASTGELVLLLASHVVLPAGALEVLEKHLAGGALAVGPLQVDWRDLVSSAGWVFAPGDAVPVALLADHPREDARRLGAVVEVPALGGDVQLLRAADLLAVRGADPLFVHDTWDVDLGLRLARREAAERPSSPRGLHLLTGVEASVGTRVAPRPRPLERRPVPAARTAANRRLLAERWGPVVPGLGHELWAAGLGTPTDATPPRPPAPVGRSGAEGRPWTAPFGVRRLRWAVQTATPPGAGGLHWGDLHFGSALARALEALGQQVVVDGRASLGRSTAHLDDVVLAVRGKVPLRPQPGAVNLLWVISHPEMVTTEEMAAYDVVFAASEPWARAASERLGRPVLPLLQATDPGRFHPDVPSSTSPHDVLFVGNSRGVDRPVVRHLVEAGLDVAVYGGGWEGRLPPGILRGVHVDNRSLPSLYRSAGVVLNDHWEDMRREGFVSNRLFDATAAGARVVSDRVEGAEEIFGGSVLTYTTSEELERLVRGGRAWFPDDAHRRAIALRVARDHSFAARARTLLDTALATRAAAGGDEPA